MPISLNRSWVHPGKNRPFCLLESQEQHESIIQSIRVPGLSLTCRQGRIQPLMLQGSCSRPSVASFAPSPSSSWHPYLELNSYRVVGKISSFKCNQVKFYSPFISQTASSCQIFICSSELTIYVATLTHFF